MKVAVEYISKEEKTKITEEDYKDLHNAIDYIESDYKTEEKNFVTSINCDYEYALEGEKVLLKVNLEAGYKLLAAYNGDGEKVELLVDISIILSFLIDNLIIL